MKHSLSLLYSLLLIVTGCAMVTMSIVKSKTMWLGLGFPLVSIGLYVSGMRIRPRKFCQRAAKFFQDRDVDLEVIDSMLKDAKITFMHRKEKAKERQ